MENNWERYAKVLGHNRWLRMGWFTLPKNTKRKSHWFFTPPEFKFVLRDHYIWFFQSVARNIERGLKFCASYVVCNQIWLNYSQICKFGQGWLPCYLYLPIATLCWLHKIIPNFFFLIFGKNQLWSRDYFGPLNMPMLAMPCNNANKKKMHFLNWPTIMIGLDGKI
jgi:hypothetical protein